MAAVAACGGGVAAGRRWSGGGSGRRRARTRPPWGLSGVSGRSLREVASASGFAFPLVNSLKAPCPPSAPPEGGAASKKPGLSGVGGSRPREPSWRRAPPRRSEAVGRGGGATAGAPRRPSMPGRAQRAQGAGRRSPKPARRVICRTKTRRAGRRRRRRSEAESRRRPPAAERCRGLIGVGGLFVPACGVACAWVIVGRRSIGGRWRRHVAAG